MVDLWLESVLGSAMVWSFLRGIDVMLIALTEPLGNFPTFFSPCLEKLLFLHSQNIRALFAWLWKVCLS